MSLPQPLPAAPVGGGIPHPSHANGGCKHSSVSLVCSTVSPQLVMPQDSSKLSLAASRDCLNHRSSLLTMQRSRCSSAVVFHISQTRHQTPIGESSLKSLVSAVSFFLSLFKDCDHRLGVEWGLTDKLRVSGLLYSSAVISHPILMQSLPADAPNWSSISQYFVPLLYNISPELLHLWQLLPSWLEWEIQPFLHLTSKDQPSRS